MPAPNPPAPLERMREALAARVEATSLRQVAREVGMSPTGLQKVLGGADSYSRTRRKLERWYVRESLQYGGGLDAAAVTAALRVAVQDLAPAPRRETLERLVSDLEKGYTSGAAAPPPWLAEVRRVLLTGD